MKLIHIPFFVITMILPGCGGADGDLDRLHVTMISPNLDMIINEGESVELLAVVSGGQEPYDVHWNINILISEDGDVGDYMDFYEASPGSVTFNDPGEYILGFTVRDAAGNFLGPDPDQYIYITVKSLPQP